MEVLIVDDDPLTREMMPPLLREALGEVSIVAVKDLESAFQRLAHHKAPDFALLDLGLPGHTRPDTPRRLPLKVTNVPGEAPQPVPPRMARPAPRTGEHTAALPSH